MDQAAAAELQGIRNELNSIISEIEGVSRKLRRNFYGIGTDRCAESVDRVVGKLYDARNRLNRMDTNTVTQEYMDRHPEIYGGGSSGGGGGHGF